MGTTSSNSGRGLTLTAGQPLNQKILVLDATRLWDTLSDLEVRAQLRTGENSTDALIDNLHNYMTWSFEGADLVILWSMTGEETRQLYAKKWGQLKTGYFNVVVSDVGTVDSNALTVPTVELKGKPSTTTASGDE